MSCLPIEPATDAGPNDVAAIGDTGIGAIRATRDHKSYEACAGNTWIGTSGWSYASWRGPFFPRDLPARRHLEFYAGKFPTTELNGVFYRTPTQEAVRGWADSTPDHFVFAWKASKFITHWKRLNDTCRNSLELLESRLFLLGKKAGPVLFQLPPRFEKNCDRLASFMKLLPPRRRYAFEFRHPSWYEDDIIDLMRDHGIAMCISDHHQAPSPWVATAGHVYVRGHGPGGRYRGRYPESVLAVWSARLDTLRRHGHVVYVYFDNDQKSAAPKDATVLMKMLEPKTRPIGPARAGRTDANRGAPQSKARPEKRRAKRLG